MIGPERERWDRLEQILRELEEVPEDERDAYLARVCPDPELRQSARLLLADEAESSGYLEGLFDGLAPKRGERADLTGRRIGAYRLLRLVARGGMGVVYEAERADAAFEQRVALKLLTMALAGGEAHERFLAERRVLAGLGHPAIAHIVDGGIADDGTPWFAMEYVEGLAVDVYCDRRQLGIRERLELFLQVCDAVEHAHRRLVVHRDLKPANVLVTEEGQVKLLDFGIAKLLDPGGKGQMVPPTRTALRLMTPEYASPEQVRGEAVTTASDVYQLGLLLYELLCGHRPYALADRSAGELEQAICEQVPTRPSVAVKGSRLQRRLRGDLDNVVLKALSKEPDRRYGSADRLAQDVRRHLSGLPVTARADTWIYRGRKFLERHAVGASAAAVVLLLVLFLVAGMTVFHTMRLQSERDRAQAEATKAKQVSEFLTTLFRSSDPREARGTEITARELLDRSVAQVDRELAGQPEIQADMLHVLGRTYLELGIYDSAESLLTRALELRRHRLGPGHRDVAGVLADFGLLLYRQGEYERARDRLGEAVRILEARRGLDAPELADVLRLQGEAHRRLGEFQQGLVTIERALAIQTRVSGEESEPVALILSGLGALLDEMGAHERAEELNERALAVHERELGVDHPLVASTLMDLANIRGNQGRRDGLEAMYRRSLAIQRKAYGPTHSRVGTVLNNLGHFLAASGRDDEAVEVLLEALEVYRSALGPNHPTVAFPLASLGDAHLAGGRLADARDFYQHAVAIRDNALGDRPFDTVLFYTLVALGHTEAELGDHQASERNMQRALAMWRQLPKPLDDSRLAPSHRYLGLWLAEQQRCTDAVPLLRRALRLRTTKQHPSTSEVAELESLLAECGAAATDPGATVAAADLP